jgi:hypothetical protein
MKLSEIRVGATYCNRGKRRTLRTVVAIGMEYRPKASYGTFTPHALGVLYTQDGVSHTLYLVSFAAWAGGEVVDPQPQGNW